MDELTTKQQLEDFYKNAFISKVKQVSYLKDNDYTIEENIITLMGMSTKGFFLKLPKSEYTQFTAQKIFNRIYAVFDNLILTPFDEPEADYVMGIILPPLNTNPLNVFDEKNAIQYSENRQLYKSGL